MKQKSSGNYPFRSKLNADKVIGLVLGITPIRKYRGTIENYLRWSMSTLKSEGKQAQDRLKAYKEYFENQLATKTVVFPRKGKYKKLIPLLRILAECLEHNDIIGIRMLETALRISDLARPSQKFLDKALREFVSAMDPEAHPVDVDPSVINRSIELEDVHALVKREQEQYPDFPWEEFRYYLAERQDNHRLIVRGTIPKVQLSATLLSKSSAAKYKYRSGSKYSLSNYKSVPAICLADIENAYYHLESEDSGHTHVSVAFANALLKSLSLDGGYTFKDDYSTYVKGTSQEVREFCDNNMLLFRVFTMVIEASKGIKERIVHKVSYPIQYPLQLFHDSLLSVAHEIQGDWSGDHDAGFKSLNSYAKTAEYIADVDATAWTDYFPLSLQYEVIKSFYGLEVADLWVILMRTPIYTELVEPDGSRKLYQYSMHIGQIMGAYASWSAAFLTHLKLVRFSYSRVQSPYTITTKSYCGKKVNFRTYSLPYWIVGDDECSADSTAQYMYIVLESALGIKINASKSKVLSREHGKYLAEFVNRLTLDGVEVSGISPKLISNSLQNYVSFADFLQFCRDRSINVDEHELVKTLVKESTTLSRQEYRRKYGQYPISRRMIDIGLRIPHCVGGLLPDDSNWNTRIDPLLLLSAMLCRISSVLTVFRPGAPLLRDGRDNADDILNNMQIVPDNIIRIDQTALAKYERRVYADQGTSLFMREIGTALETYLSTQQRIYRLAAIADYSTIDLEQMKQWFTTFLARVKQLSAVPFYMAREYETKSKQITVRKLRKLDPNKYSDLDLWSDDINVEYQRIVDDLKHYSGSIYPKKNKTETRDELQSFYESLFS